MASELTRVPAYRHTMARLEEIKRVTPQGQDYWLAREVHRLLGYPVWDKFVPVIQRARDSLDANGVESSHHIAQTSKMVGVASGAQRRGVEFFLSRAACYLIAMNGDPSKPEIAAAQAYFAIQTRNAELSQHKAKDRKRLDTRDRVAAALKRIGAVAKDVGVQRYGLFHDARYRGLYGASAKEVGKKKGLKPEEKLLDRAAALELSAHEFQPTLLPRRYLTTVSAVRLTRLPRIWRLPKMSVNLSSKRRGSSWRICRWSLSQYRS